MSVGLGGPSTFAPDYRASGLLLHVTSLPSRYGIGDVGPGALEWIDRLREAGQSWWQSLPLGPTGYGNSPYQPLSSFAGNEFLISPDWLVEDGLLRKDDCEGCNFPPGEIDYDAVFEFKRRLIRKAWANFAGAPRRSSCRLRTVPPRPGALAGGLRAFSRLEIQVQRRVLSELAAGTAERVPAQLDQARGELADTIGLVCFAQFLIFRQGERLKEYAHARM